MSRRKSSSVNAMANIAADIDRINHSWAHFGLLVCVGHVAMTDWYTGVGGHLVEAGWAKKLAHGLFRVSGCSGSCKAAVS
ncbi:hypothetical protein TIFTF001_016075 [Ficus carica]|uniref:Uncharacterized protein n=1 Tax=Ficus carica TaxID=3494 RepID=A0AA88AIV6_FICCA|nr:hypothetical protein TIFTF001_016075 [Ficus carica]